MEIKAVIFDLDGTLLNSIEDIVDTYNDVFKQNSLPVYTVEFYKKNIGGGIRNFIISLIPDKLCTEKYLDKLYQEFEEIYQINLGKKSKPFDGITEMLHELKIRGVKTAVLSNKPHADTIKCIDSQFPSHSFAIVQGSEEGTPLKPDPTTALNISKGLSIPESNIAFIGDTPIDISTAISSNMLPIGVSWGFSSEAQIREAGKCTIVHSPEDLTNLLLV